MDRKIRYSCADCKYHRTGYHWQRREVRHCAFIRGKAIVGEGAVVGNSTELKNAVLFNKVQVLIIIMLEMLCWDISPTWVPDRSVPT